MKTVWSNQIDNILKCGHSLSGIGVSNWALKKSEAVNALTKFAELQVPILGGDVCELIDGVIQYNYDNWYCQQMQGEAKADFIVRSIEKANQYIENYRTKEPDKIFFAFVPGV
jgi:hypothetical protein